MKGRRIQVPTSRKWAVCVFSMYIVFQGAILRSAWSDKSSLQGQAWKSKELFSNDTRRHGHSRSKENYVDWPVDLEAEIQKGLDYVRSIKNTKRKLVFVHIPKTAGTTIEEIAGNQGQLAWGSCLFNHRPRRQACQYPPGQFEWPTKIGYWHLPTQLFPLMGLNPYEGADLFAIVRNPYERLLSEFYYICRRKITRYYEAIDCNRSRVQEPGYMNEWIQHNLQHSPTSNLSPKDYLEYNGHFTPQYDFLVSRPANVRVVDYVLRMDTLAVEFPALMKAYNISVVMLPHKNNVARNETTDLAVRHFDGSTLTCINKKYGNDAKLF